MLFSSSNGNWPLPLKAPLLHLGLLHLGLLHLGLLHRGRIHLQIQFTEVFRRSGCWQLLQVHNIHALYFEAPDDGLLAVVYARIANVVEMWRRRNLWGGA